MPYNNVIKFDPKSLILEKAQLYVESVDIFLEDIDKAISLLLKALRYADFGLKQKIIMLLGGFARQDIADHLYKIMIDPNESEDIRYTAAIQLSVTASDLKKPQPLIDKLLQDIKENDLLLKQHAALALGWKGNSQAVMPLLEMLYDSDIDLQQTAVNALVNLQDDRLFGLMLDRLKNGSKEQKRCILCNLWRFHPKKCLSSTSI